MFSLLQYLVTNSLSNDKIKLNLYHQMKVQVCIAKLSSRSEGWKLMDVTQNKDLHEDVLQCPGCQTQSTIPSFFSLLLNEQNQILFFFYLKK